MNSDSTNAGLPASFALAPGSPPIVIEGIALHLLVLESGQVVEDYAGCSPFFPDAWNARLRNAGSRVTFDASAFPPPAFDLSGWPADVDAVPLAGGTDGVRMLSPADLIGGLDALDPLREPTLIAMPDACASGAVPLRQPPPPPIPPVCTDPQFLVACAGSMGSLRPWHRPGSAVQGRIRRLQGLESGRRDRMARQEGA